MELESALELYLNKVVSAHTLATEEIAVTEAFGRITSQAIFAKISSPHYNASAMDGIALRASVTFGASDTTPVILEEGIDYICVDTGDPIPDEYDAVVMIEDVINIDSFDEFVNNTPQLTDINLIKFNSELSDIKSTNFRSDLTATNPINFRSELTDNKSADSISSKKIKLISAISPWQNIRQIGEDLCENDMIIPSNTIIEAASIGAIMAGGIMKVKTWVKPIVGIIPTGDEIVMPKEKPEKGEIIEFNSSIFSAILSRIGALVKVYPIVPDKKDEIRNTVFAASQECDLVILNAGSSAGREDYSAEVLSELGEVFVHGIAIKPGKPTILAIVNSRPIIGVPGYPVSGIIVMEKIVKNILYKTMNIKNQDTLKVKAILTRNIVSSLKYKEFVRVKLGFVGDRIVATPLNRGAAVVTSFVKADGIMEIPINSEGFIAGQEVLVDVLKSETAIRNTLVAIGSHDPLMDVIADILRQKASNYDLSSSHVGSMGGITAIKRKEAHIAGIHLLDEKTGNYNFSYIEKYLGKDNTALIKGVRRIQGLIVAAGNPKSILSVNNLLREEREGKTSFEMRYVNRQKGSGTRILLDYLLSSQNIDGESIYGYNREEFTHMNVAAIIESGNADAGLGIYSAAKAFGLDFVPICEENYDFIAPVEYLEFPAFKEFMEIIKSDKFKESITALGGYVIDDKIGEITIV